MQTPTYTAEVANAMRNVEERLTLVEHKVAENARGIEGLREAVVELGARMDRRFEVVDHNMSRQFRWIVGIQITTMLAVVGALGAIAAAALGR